MISAIVAPILFWGGLYFIPFSRALKILIAIFVLAVGWSGYAKAQTVPLTPLGEFYQASFSGNTVVFENGSVTPTNVSRATFSHAANGPVNVTSEARFRTAGGSLVPIVTKSAPSALAIAKTIGSGIAMASNVGMVLVAGVALYEFAKEMGFNVSSSGGVATVTKSDPNLCTVAPCYLWNAQANGLPGTYPTQSALCAAALAANPSSGDYVSILTITATGCDIMQSYKGGSPQFAGRYTAVKTPRSGVDVGQPVPSSPQELQDAIASKTAWPATSKIDDALRDAIKAGAPLQLPKPSQITGPLEVVYPPKTVINPDGSKTVTTTKEKITFGSDSSIKVDTETNTKTFDPAGVVTGTTLTTDSPPVPEPKPDEGSVSDTPLTGIPKLYTPKYPNGLTGVWDQKIIAIKALPLFNVAANLMPNVASGGTCPHWFINLNLGPNMNYGSHDVAPPCWIWDFGKFVIVISALLLARRLVFGG